MYILHILTEFNQRIIIIILKPNRWWIQGYFIHIYKLEKGLFAKLKIKLCNPLPKKLWEAEIFKILFIINLNDKKEPAVFVNAIG